MTRRDAELIAQGFYFGHRYDGSLAAFWDALLELGYENLCNRLMATKFANDLVNPRISRLLCVVAQGSWEEVDRMQAAIVRLDGFQILHGY